MRLLIAGLLLASLADATPVTLLQLNQGFSPILINGQLYEVLDYTGDRHAPINVPWNATLYTFQNLSSAYYSPSDPVKQLASYVQDYIAWTWLFEQLILHPSDAGAIQQAAYFISDPADFNGNSYSTSAVTKTLADLGNTSGFFFIDSTNYDLRVTPLQGFVGFVPEASSWLLLGLGLCSLGVIQWRRSSPRDRLLRRL
jgi:hypothetical protein